MSKDILIWRHKYRYGRNACMCIWYKNTWHILYMIIMCICICIYIHFSLYCAVNLMCLELGPLLLVQPLFISSALLSCLIFQNAVPRMAKVALLHFDATVFYSESRNENKHQERWDWWEIHGCSSCLSLVEAIWGQLCIEYKCICVCACILCEVICLICLSVHVHA